MWDFFFFFIWGGGGGGGKCGRDGCFMPGFKGFGEKKKNKKKNPGLEFISLI